MKFKVVSIKFLISLIENLFSINVEIFLSCYASTYIILILPLGPQSLKYFIYYLALNRRSLPNPEQRQNPKPFFNVPWALYK